MKPSSLRQPEKPVTLDTQCVPLPIPSLKFGTSQGGELGFWKWVPLAPVRKTEVGQHFACYLAWHKLRGQASCVVAQYSDICSSSFKPPTRVFGDDAYVRPAGACVSGQLCPRTYDEARVTTSREPQHSIMEPQSQTTAAYASWRCCMKTRTVG